VCEQNSPPPGGAKPTDRCHILAVPSLTIQLLEGGPGLTLQVVGWVGVLIPASEFEHSKPSELVGSLLSPLA